MVVQRRDGPRRLRELDDDDDYNLTFLVFYQLVTVTTGRRLVFMRQTDGRTDKRKCCINIALQRSYLAC